MANLPNPIPLAPLHEPYEHRINYQQQQIQDLTEQCRDLRTQLSHQSKEISELEQNLDAQQEHAKATVKSLQDKWKLEKKNWKEADDKRNRTYRIAALDFQRELCERHLEEIRLQEVIRQETIATTVREFKITQFLVAEQEKDREFGITDVSLSLIHQYTP